MPLLKQHALKNMFADLESEYGIFGLLRIITDINNDGNSEEIHQKYNINKHIINLLRNNADLCLSYVLSFSNTLSMMLSETRENVLNYDFAENQKGTARRTSRSAFL
jgi:hypothetical protein